MKTMWIIMGFLFMAGCSVIGIRTSEEPPFKILTEESNIEIRQYGDILVAETEVVADYEESTKIGFRRLAGYIFGKNASQKEIAMTAPVVREKESEKIAMTAPVLQEQSDKKWIMSFVLPSAYTMKTLPKPLDDKVIIKAVPCKKVASIRYTGFLSEKNFQQKAEQLKNWLIENQYTLLSEPRSAGYDPPWTIPFLRRNEVLIDIQ